MNGRRYLLSSLAWWSSYANRSDLIEGRQLIANMVFRQSPVQMDVMLYTTLFYIGWSRAHRQGVFIISAISIEIVHTQNDYGLSTDFER